MLPPPPRISGKALDALCKLSSHRVGAMAIKQIFRKDLGLNRLDKLPMTFRGRVPLDNAPLAGRAPRAPEDAKLGAPRYQGWARDAATIVADYTSKKLDPVAVTEHVLAQARALASRANGCGPVYEYCETEALKAAQASRARYAEGKPLSALDGIPFVVKEEIAVAGLRCQAGTAVKGGGAEERDATIVRLLREAGAIVIGTTAMTEYGLSPIGFNPKRPMPRNPHDPRCVAGGSSTGTGVAVGTGLVPFGLGADGGGSIRIPASLNGVFGIKPTWGRISRAGDVFGGTVEHVGPLACGTAELAEVLEITAGVDAADDQTNLAPAPKAGTWRAALGRGVKGLRIGTYKHEWQSAPAHIAGPCRAALDRLAAEGAEIIEIDADIAAFAGPIGVIGIGGPAAADLAQYYRTQPESLGQDLRISVAALLEFTTVEYIDAQRLRTALRLEVQRHFERVDLIASPTLGVTAPEVTDDEMASGFLDAPVVEALTRYTFLANLTGLPAGSVPVGKDSNGRPVGLQICGDAWDEATVLAAMAHLERLGVARAERPQVTAAQV
jgi:aspartyl-tRNA(Asn)/glutamyl-tRNA(Gln) amidotransferase subunit A